MKGETALQPRPYPPEWADAWGIDERSPFPFVEFDLSPSTMMRLRWVPPGRFLMGSSAEEVERLENEGPQHWVQLSSGLWLAETPCTQAQWRAIMGKHPVGFADDEQRPVVQVSWEDCETFCKVLNAQRQGMRARLPTEAEWEYACRAGTVTEFNLGTNVTPEQVNYDGNYPYVGGVKGQYRQKMVPAGTLAHNAWGLYEMHGNVWEWCADWFGPYAAEEQQDPAGAAAGQFRVIRGGGWYSFARSCRSAYRFRFEPGDRGDNLSFRLAADNAEVSQAGAA